MSPAPRRRPRTRVALTDEPWRTADRLLVVDEPDPRRTQRWAAGVLTAVAVGVFVVALRRDDLRCGQVCFGDPPNDRFGSRSYEPGHAWTSYAASWQWDAQSTLALLVLVVTLVGLGLLLTGTRRAHATLAAGALGSLGWIGWVLLTPAP